MRPAFIINVRNKAKHIAKSIGGALAQSVPCDIIVSDYDSADQTLEIARASIAELPRGADHTARVIQCPLGGAQGSLLSMNNHVWWIIHQTDAEWIFQSSGDDYSLPDRVKACMEAVASNPCSAVATTMYFEEPGQTDRQSVSGFPTTTGYVKPGEGLARQAYGSTIGGYRRDFLLKIGEVGAITPDVYWGFLAALDQGFYVVANPQHVHVTHADTENTGFQGKLRGATGDESMRLNELNHFQLLALFDACYAKAMELHPNGIPQEAFDPLMGSIYGQAKAWLGARKVLHANKITPGVL